MDHLNSLKRLSSFMGLETAEDYGCPKFSDHRTGDIYITHAMLPNGNRIPLLKTLLTSVCERNCNYCPFRAGRDFRRATLSPDEMAQVCMSLFRAGIVKGLFLSSGIAGGGISIQEKIIDTTEILRNKYHFTGYIHAKIMPGAEQDQIERLMHLSDRVSINLEAPNAMRLKYLAPKKDYDKEIISSLQSINKIRNHLPAQKAWKAQWPSVTTQFVVGPAEENDTELLTTTSNLYKTFHLGRVYFMGFNPVPDTPFDNIPPTNPRREHRLYQASYLLRDYGFDAEEISFDKDGFLHLESDPKKVWADIHFKQDPVEINKAERRILLRIPGIGPKSADAIIKSRRIDPIKDISDLKRIGVNPSRSLHYIVLNGKRPNIQQTLF